MEGEGLAKQAMGAKHVEERMKRDRAAVRPVQPVVDAPGKTYDTFDADAFIDNPATWNLIRVAIRHSPADIRKIHDELEPGFRDYFSGRGYRRPRISNLAITLIGVYTMSANPQIAQAMATFGIRSKGTYQSAWNIFLRVSSQKAQADLNDRAEKRDPEFIRNGGFGRHFPNCKGAADTTLIRTSKHPVRIRADYSGKHKAHGKRGLVIVNSEGRVCWVCPRLFSGRHADIYCAKQGHMARALRYVEKVRGRHRFRYIEVMVDGGFPSLEKKIPNLVAPFRRSRGVALTSVQLAHNRRLHEVRQIVERFFGRMKKHLNIVGTIYRGDLENLPQIWLAAVWLTDLHIASHPMNAEDVPDGDGQDEDPQTEQTPSDAPSDSSAPPEDSETPEEAEDDD